jgi:hypothetical protein
VGTIDKEKLRESALMYAKFERVSQETGVPVAIVLTVVSALSQLLEEDKGYDDRSKR